MNKKFMYQFGNNKKKLCYDARPTKYQHHIEVSKDVRIRGYFSKPKEIRE